MLPTSVRALLTFGLTGSVLILSACGSATPPAHAPERASTPAPEHAGRPEHAAADTAEQHSPQAETVDAGVAASQSDPPCAGLALADCRRQAGRCVWDGACRDPVDACEAVVPNPTWSGMPIFTSGDPCENVRPECAWNPALGRCSVYAPVPACPATLTAARAATVLCNHSGQLQLECHYGSTHCECDAPAYCGGAPPTPDMESPARAFTCVPPFDARGCPTGAVREGAPCHLGASVVCESCSTSAQCVGGHWHVRRLQPRP